MITINVDITPGVGAGGIALGMASDELTELAIASNQDFVQIAHSPLHVFLFCNGTISVLVDPTPGVVVGVVCHLGYRGSFKGISPGICLQDLQKKTSRCWIVDGYLFFDDVLLLGLDIPERWQNKLLDDVDKASQLPPGLVFESIRVFTKHNSPAVRLTRGKC